MCVNLPLLLFAKAPIAGKVKTRLQSHCSPEQAAEIACILMEESIRNATKHWPGSTYLSVWLDSEHPFFSKMKEQYATEIVQQCDGGLGAKMQHALDTFGYPAAVMGCDAPHVTPHTLRSAYQHLQQGVSVVGPSEDGGYYLLGLSEPANELFTDIPWGGNQVLERTLIAASQIQRKLVRLDALNDVDEWRDLASVVSDLPTLSNYLKREGLQI